MTTIEIPGRAGARLAELGERARVSDLYGENGAAIYHRVAVSDAVEVRELLALARRTDGPILDLAAGSGRITMPLLTLGRSVTALELSTPMLDLLRAQADRLPGRVAERLTVVQGDMSAFTLPVRFGAIVLGITSIGLLDEPGRQGLYRCVRGHLAPGGSFLVTLVSPDADAADVDPDLAFDIGDGTVMYSHALPGAPVRHVTVIREHPGQDVVDVCTSQVHEITAAQLSAELDVAGLAITRTVPLVGKGMPGHVHEVFEVHPTSA